MVCFHSSVPVDQQMGMAKSVNSTDPCSKLRNKKIPNSPNQSSIPACQQSRSAAIDVLILIAVIGALGFLIFPSIKLLIFNSVEIVETMVYVVREEVSEDPIIYGCLGLSILCAVMAVLAIAVCMSRKCGVVALSEKWKFRDQRRLERLRNSVHLLVTFHMKHIRIRTRYNAQRGMPFRINLL
ncbi:hypothetical protein TEA_018721 [Camellia sinensis var. sinensis]|uniref:Uncharacterized protein n=1 Tax=Camellia sinensis var. sinensis TaxID=542762 RepID=A0A4S4D7B6_CAMSN|nr:hypothetical protein TEA_018721 [Camellia sinensis var. sinensis]